MKFNILLIIVFAKIILSSCNEVAEESPNEQHNQKVIQDEEVIKDIKPDTTGLAIFLEQLQIIVSNKDSLALDAIMKENIDISYGGGIYGKQAFYEYWYAEDQPKDTLWNILSKLISYGGNYSDHFLAYRYPFFASDDLFDCPIECMFYAANIVENPTLYDHKNNKVKKDLPLYTCLIIKRDTIIKEGFERILLPNETIPYYISNKDIYGCSDLNLIIEKNENGKWYITAFAT